MGSASPQAPEPPAWPLALLFWLNPFWGLLAVFDPQRPVLPLVPAPVAAAFGLVAVLVTGAAAMRAIRAPASRNWKLAFAAGGLASLVSAVLGFDPVTGIGFSLAMLGAALGAFAIAVARPLATRACTNAFLWSALCACGAALLMLVLRHPATLYAYGNGRAIGTFLNPNELGAFAILALGVALPRAVAAREPLAIATAAVAAATLAATFSRWGIASAACACLVYALAARDRRVAFGALGVVVAGLCADVAFGGTHHNPVDLQTRGPAWAAGLATFAHFPLTGVGPLAYGRTYDVMRPPDGPAVGHPVAFDPHSLPLSLAASGGVLGLGTLLLSVAFALRAMVRASRDTNGVERLTVLGLVAGFAGMAVDSLPNTLVIVIPLGYQAAGLAFAIARNERA